MKVSEIMTTNLITARADDPLRDIATKMVEQRCGSTPITDDAGLLIGIITLRDIMLPLYPNMGSYQHDDVPTHDFEAMETRYRDLLDKPARAIMTPEPTSVSAETPVLKAASYMGLKNLRRIPVTDDNNRLIGMVSISDIHRGLLAAAS